MNSKRIIELQEDQLKLSAQREKMYLEQLVRQSEQIESLSVQVGSLTETIRSLEKSLLQKMRQAFFQGSNGCGHNVSINS